MLKHLQGKHNQSTHGNKRAGRRAYVATYREARASGASVSDARTKAKEAATAKRQAVQERLKRMRKSAKETPKETSETPIQRVEKMDLRNPKDRRALSDLIDSQYNEVSRIEKERNVFVFSNRPVPEKLDREYEEAKKIGESTQSLARKKMRVLANDAIDNPSTDKFEKVTTRPNRTSRDNPVTQVDIVGGQKIGNFIVHKMNYGSDYQITLSQDGHPQNGALVTEYLPRKEAQRVARLLHTISPPDVEADARYFGQLRLSLLDREGFDIQPRQPSGKKR